VHGSVVSKGAVTFAANTDIDGCAISIGAMSLAAGSSVIVPEAVTSAPTMSPATPGPAALTGSLVSADPLNPIAAGTDGLCNNFAVHKGTAITFATNKIRGGNVGVSPGAAITGGHALGVNASVSAGTNGPLSFNPATVNAAFIAATNILIVANDTAPEIGGKTFTPGTYRASGSGTFNIKANTDVTLDGKGPYLFQAHSTMLAGGNCNIFLTGGAQAEDVVWALGTAFAPGADSVFQGSILVGSAVTIGARNKFYGDIFTEGAITLGANVGIDGCAIIALSAVAFGAGAYVDSISETVQQLAAALSCNMCEGYAACGGTAITFGATNKVGSGSVGGASGVPITGTYEGDDGTVETIADSVSFATAMTDAFTEAWTQAGGGEATEPEISGKTFKSGIYKASGSGTFNIKANTNVTLDGEGPYLFQATSTMLTGANVNIILTNANGAKAEDVAWALGSASTSGADNTFQGSIRAGSVITVGARNTVHGSVFAGTAVSLGADVTLLDGCAIALGPVTFGAGNYISSAEMPEYCGLDSITDTTPEVTATIVAPSCSTDIVLKRQIGLSNYTDIPIAIISQDSAGEVTFEISQKWTTENNLANLTLRFKDDYLTFPKCHAFDDVDFNWTREFTAVCTKKSKIAVVEVWASGDSFTRQSDDAVPPNCTLCRDTAINTPLVPMVKYVFQVECVSTCTGICPTTGR
jgi:hypothetical protein